jgi:hypothetical protein
MGPVPVGSDARIRDPPARVTGSALAMPVPAVVASRHRLYDSVCEGPVDAKLDSSLVSRADPGNGLIQDAGGQRQMSRVRELLSQHAPGAFVDRSWPLTPFETLMWLDDREDYPLEYEILLRFTGPVDPDAIRDAWQFALGRHPLLRSTIRPQERKLVWHAPAVGWGELAVAAAGSGGPPARQRLSLEHRGGIAGSLAETASGWDLRLLIHHACCDGHGARMFLQDLVLAYVVLRGASRHADPFFRADIAHLDRRGEFAVDRGPGQAPWQRLYRALLFAIRRPSPVAASIPPVVAHQGGAATALGVCFHTFPSEQVARMNLVRQAYRATFNDLAVAMLFEVLGDWQRAHAVAPRSRIRIAVPTDLRSREDERMPATNRYTYLFLDRRVDACGSWASILADVQRDLQEQRQSRRGLEFLDGLRLAARHKRLLEWFVHGGSCFTTAVLTNLGDPSWRLRKRLHVDADGMMWLDGARCTDIRIQTPPLRPRTRWGVGISEYAGRMTISFRYDATTMRPADADDVLRRYVSEWDSLLEAPV